MELQEKIGMPRMLKSKNFFQSEHRIVFTKKADDGTNITRKLLKLGYKNIVAVGGDGTINEVANGFFSIKAKNRSALNPAKFKPEPKLEQVNPNGVFWIVPSGSRNVLEHHLEYSIKVLNRLSICGR